VTPLQYAKLLEHGAWHEAAEGDVVVRRGRPLNHVLLLQSGSVRGRAPLALGC